MILSNEDIKKCLREGVIKIEPAPREEQIGPASVDLTLRDEFYRIKKEYTGKTVDLKKLVPDRIHEKVVAESVVLKPGEIILGKTVEKITLPANICGHIEGRSKFARVGMAIHVTSGFIHPGVSNHQVLEIVNLSPYKMKLCARMSICQVIFEYLKTSSTKPYSKFGKVAVNQ